MVWGLRYGPTQHRIRYEGCFPVWAAGVWVAGVWVADGWVAEVCGQDIEETAAMITKSYTKIILSTNHDYIEVKLVRTPVPKTVKVFTPNLG